jgi:Domain of unknown function (DUF5666)
MKPGLIISLLAAALLVSGCGGGGSGGGAIGAAPSAPIFITDSLDNHQHVWVTITRVVLQGGGAAVTVFEPAGGLTVDLRTLHDGFGERFNFLAKAPEGVFDAITFTMDKDLVLFEIGSQTGLHREFAGNDGTSVELVLAFSPPRTITPASSLVVDFDLANWVDNGTIVTGSPFLAESSGIGLDDENRHEHDDIEGVISDLSGTAPNQTFTLLREEDTVLVMTTPETELEDIVALANGMHVEVEGFFSMTASAFIAESIESEEDDDDLPEVLGRVNAIDSQAGTFDMVIEAVEHFMPPFNVIHIVTNGQTEFRDADGDHVNAAAFFMALQLNALIEAEGPFDPGTNTVTADRVSFEEGEDDDEEIEGVISDLSGDPPNQTFTLVTEDDAGTVFVMTTPETELEGIVALANGMHVEVEGFFSTTANAFIAESIELEDEEEAEAEGPVFAIDGQAGTFDLTIEEADNFDPPLAFIHVVTNAQTVFKDDEGDVVTAAAFFLALEEGMDLGVRGTFDPSTNTLTAVRVSFEEEDD